METAMTMAATSGWLDSNAGGAATTGGCGSLSSITVSPYWPYPYYYPVHESPARPIKLTLADVERLRKAAKADEKLKAILQKFTNLIEITVSFD